MFSGIIEEIGFVKALINEPGLLTLIISAKLCLEELKIGDSIAVNGVCLTVCSFDCTSFTVQAIPETIKRTNLGNLTIGADVNLERSITAKTRIGGHFVQGHIDMAVKLLQIDPEGQSLKIRFEMPNDYKECFIPKGFIAIDGMSLTLVDVSTDFFSICFIPHTQHQTIVQNYKIGVEVNIEIDSLTKTVLHIVNQRIANEYH